MYLIETVSTTAAGTVQLDTLSVEISKLLNVPRGVVRTIKRFGCFGADSDFTELKIWKGSELCCKAGIHHAAAYDTDAMLNVGVDYTNEKIPIEITGANAITSETIVIEYTDRKSGNR